VRTTAAQVQKRLIQYYYNPDHAGELVIALPLGSYVPSFRGLARPSTASDGKQVTAEYVESLPQHPLRRPKFPRQIPKENLHVLQFTSGS
jgi:hypothetical protein